MYVVVYHPLPCLLCLPVAPVEFSAHTNSWPHCLSAHQPPVTHYISTIEAGLEQLTPCSHSILVVVIASLLLSWPNLYCTGFASLDLFCLFIYWICFVCLLWLPACCWLYACQTTVLSHLSSHLLCLRCPLFWVPFQHTHGPEFPESKGLIIASSAYTFHVEFLKEKHTHELPNVRAVELDLRAIGSSKLT